MYRAMQIYSQAAMVIPHRGRQGANSPRTRKHFCGFCGFALVCDEAMTDTFLHATETSHIMAATSGSTSNLPPLDIWIAWLVASLFFTYSFFQRVAPSVVSDDLQLAFQIDGSAVGVLSSTYFYAYIAV